MFGNNDKLSLALINARDINGNIIPFSLKLPLNSGEYILPKELASIDVFEYHDGLVNGGTIVFSVCIGEITTIKNLSHEIEKNNVEIQKNIQIASIDSPICIQNISGKQIVFTTINEQDIVVENQEQLIFVIEQLSHNFNIINDSVKKIRMLSKKKTK